MKVLVCGDRNWTDRNFLYYCLDKILEEKGNFCVIEGDASGADKMAGDWALLRDQELQVFSAEWHKHGKAAGPIRNTLMLQQKPDLVVAFHDDIDSSKGTANMVKQARKANIEVRVLKTISLKHDWFDPQIEYPHLKIPGQSCRRCGVMRGKISETRECPGVVRIELRWSS